jgi:heat-inducible transcriptional repressor
MNGSSDRISSDPGAIASLDARSRDIFRRIVDSYLATGEPVGSRHLSRMLPISLSPASVRNVMQDLEELGLVYAPHTSAGRLPTVLGLRFFVDSLLELGDVAAADRGRIDAEVNAAVKTGRIEGALAEATSLLSDLARGAGVVLTNKDNARLKQIEFVRLEPQKALAVLVAEDGSIENRIVDTPAGMSASTLVDASNYLNARLRGRTLGETRADIEAASADARRELDALTARLVDAGLAFWSGAEQASQQLIVRGQANLLDDVTVIADLERLRALFEMLETRETMLRLLDASKRGDGVQIYIGAQSHLFGLAGCSVIIAPYQNSREEIVGAIGVIGPTRINYARIIPMVDYTAKVIGRLIG